MVSVFDVGVDGRVVDLGSAVFVDFVTWFLWAVFVLVVFCVVVAVFGVVVRGFLGVVSVVVGRWGLKVDGRARGLTFELEELGKCGGLGDVG